MIPFPIEDVVAVVYSGPSNHLAGSTGIARDSQRGQNWVLIQWDSTPSLDVYGWYEYPRGSFDLRLKPTPWPVPKLLDNQEIRKCLT